MKSEVYRVWTFTSKNPEKTKKQEKKGEQARRMNIRLNLNIEAEYISFKFIIYYYFFCVTISLTPAPSIYEIYIASRFKIFFTKSGSCWELRTLLFS